MTKWRLPKLLSDLSELVAPSEPRAEPEAGLDDEPEDEIPRGDRPIDRSVRWLPGGWGEHGPVQPHRYELFVEQEVLRAVGEHAGEEVEGSYGLLAGRLLACRQTRVPYVHVEWTHRADGLLPGDEDLTSFREFFWRAREEASRRDRVVVGWYHTHSLLGLQLSERDRQLHVAHFKDEWPVALVVVTRNGGVEGGFFQRDRGDILFRRSTRPFYEIVTQQVRPGGGPYVSAVAWQNYWTHEPVLYAGQPGDAGTGGKWFWRRDKAPPDSAETLTGLGLAGRLGEQDVIEASSTPPGTDVAPREADTDPDVRFPEPAMARPKRRDDSVLRPGRGIAAKPLAEDEWADWKKSRETREEQRVQEDLARREREMARTEPEQTIARTRARSEAEREAREAAQAAALAAADALGLDVDRVARPQGDESAAAAPEVTEPDAVTSEASEVVTEASGEADADLATVSEGPDAPTALEDQTELRLEERESELAEPDLVPGGEAATIEGPAEERPADVALKELEERSWPAVEEGSKAALRDERSPLDSELVEAVEEPVEGEVPEAGLAEAEDELVEEVAEVEPAGIEEGRVGEPVEAAKEPESVEEAAGELAEVEGAPVEAGELTRAELAEIEAEVVEEAIEEAIEEAFIEEPVEAVVPVVELAELKEEPAEDELVEEVVIEEEAAAEAELAEPADVEKEVVEEEPVEVAVEDEVPAVEAELAEIEAAVVEEAIEEEPAEAELEVEDEIVEVGIIAEAVEEEEEPIDKGRIESEPLSDVEPAWLDEELDAGGQVPDWEPAAKAPSREESAWESLDFSDSPAKEPSPDAEMKTAATTEMPLFVLPEALPFHQRLPLSLHRHRRFVPWIGIGLALAAGGAWFLLS